MIRAECIPAEGFPTLFAAVPNIGDLVENKKAANMRVASVMQSMTSSYDIGLNRTYAVPFIVVTLDEV